MTAKIAITLEALVRLKADARGFSFLPRQPVHSLLSGRHESRLRGRGLAFEELRRYVEGDDIRTMDWRATARLRKPHVRVYSEERERPVLLVVDQRSPMFFGSRRAMKSVTAAEVAALGAWRTLQSGDRVGGIVFNERELVDLKPHRSQTRVLRVMHEVARLNQVLAKEIPAGKISLNNAFEAALRRATHDHLVVVISDLDGADEKTQRLATQLAAHNDVLIVAVYDPLGASLQSHTGMVAATQEGKITLPTENAFAESFRNAFVGVLNEWTQIFKGLRIPVLPLTTVEPPAEQIRELFGQHSDAG